ncbi:hypothetical protein HU200_014864 [Digitaria exilis]|uniref:Uncharacterized protein n=1 Tax=Digitaria exilis TaxID=1010633 RepID=A0A835KJY6_9POAL|nr:hypothetical protein HU200_014864 [Digitaria exilis]
MPVLPSTEILDWWLALRQGHNRLKQRGIDSMVQLTIWSIWKERNNRVTGSLRTRPSVAWVTWCTTYGWRVRLGFPLGRNGWPPSAGPCQPRRGCWLGILRLP